MKEYFIIVFSILILYYIIPKLKEIYINFHRRKTTKKFTDICDKVRLNMNIEDSMKVYKNKIEHRYTHELHRRIPETEIYDPVPINELMSELRKNFKIDEKLDKNILELSKQGNIEEFMYGKHPYLPYEKIYIGFLQNQKIGYLLEKKNNKYTKRTYVLTRLWNLNDVFPEDMAIKIQSVIPPKILIDIHHYKYDEGKDKPMSVYLSINQNYKTENIMEVFTRILKVLGTKEKIIEEANKYMEKYKENKSNYIGLTNKNGEYFVTLYYNSKSTIHD